MDAELAESGSTVFVTLAPPPMPDVAEVLALNVNSEVFVPVAVELAVKTPESATVKTGVPLSCNTSIESVLL
jgi:hypothetical protein